MSNLRQALDKIEKEDTIKVTPEFTKKVQEYVIIDDRVKELQKATREERKKLQPLEEDIIKYLTTVGEDIIEITGGKIRKKRTETKVPLRQDIIRETLREKIDNPDEIDALMERMNEKRPVNIKESLKREYTKKH